MSKQPIKRALPVNRYLSVNLHGLARPAVWGCATAVALLVVAFATQTPAGRNRLGAVYNAVTGKPSELELRAAQRERDLESKTRRLVDSMRGLSEDRDQLLARLSVLERNYEDVTGSIGRLANAATPSAEQLFPLAASTELAPVVAPPQPIAPVATLPATTVERDPAVVSQTGAVETTSARTDFGVDLGGGPSLAALRATWNQVRRNHPALLEGLRPVIAVRDGKGGQVDLRLVAGPIPNAAAAAKLCAALSAGGLPCQPAMFDGQRLALR